MWPCHVKLRGQSENSQYSLALMIFNLSSVSFVFQIQLQERAVGMGENLAVAFCVDKVWRGTQACESEVAVRFSSAPSERAKAQGLNSKRPCTFLSRPQWIFQWSLEFQTPDPVSLLTCPSILIDSLHCLLSNLPKEAWCHFFSMHNFFLGTMKEQAHGLLKHTTSSFPYILQQMSPIFLWTAFRSDLSLGSPHWHY